MDDGHEFDGCSEGASAAEDNGLWGGWENVVVFGVKIKGGEEIRPTWWWNRGFLSWWKEKGGERFEFLSKKDLNFYLRKLWLYICLSKKALTSRLFISDTEQLCPYVEVVWCLWLKRFCCYNVLIEIRNYQHDFCTNVTHCKSVFHCGRSWNIEWKHWNTIFLLMWCQK
jgi:hypothetical protein